MSGHYVVYNPARGVYCRACPWWNLTTEDHSIDELRALILEHKAGPVCREDPRGVFPGSNLEPAMAMWVINGERVGRYPTAIPKIRRRS